jgi:hypothetical protein
MPKKKDEESREILPVSNVSAKLNDYRDSHWRATQQVMALEAKLKEKKDERKKLEEEMKGLLLADKALWTQIEFAF